MRFNCNRAQSTTVGVILLVTVFIVTATTIGLVVVDEVDSGSEPLISADFEANGTDLSMEHLGGDAVANGDLRVIVDADGNTTRLELGPADEEFAVGDSREFEESLPSGARTRVELVHAPSDSILDEGTVVAGGGKTENGTIEGTVTGDEAATLRGAGASFSLRRLVVPVEGATVTVEGTEDVADATTTADGDYRIEGLAPGEYEVDATAAEFGATTATATVEPNETTTVDLRLDPLAPAEFAVTIDDADAQVDAGEPVVVNATVENVGDKEGTQTVELSTAGAVVDSQTLTLAGGESRQVSLAWQTLPTDVGETELAVASEDDTETTTVEVLDAETDAVAYVDRDGNGEPDETFTAVELTFLNDLDGHFVVFEDASVPGSVAVDADRVTVEEDVTVSATAIELVGGTDVSLGEGATLDASSGGLFGASAGDVAVQSGGRIGARGASATTAARGLFGASAGDVDVSAASDVDVSGGAFDATGQALFGSGDGTIRIASDDGTVTATDATFDPDPTIESDDE